jgi:hypothetical protein
MRLELGSFPVREVELGARPTGYREGVLTIDHAELTRALLADRRLRGVTLDVVRPGESARVIHLLDAVEPRVKGSGGGTAFPGFLGSPEPVGSGRTHRLGRRGGAADGRGVLGARRSLRPRRHPGHERAGRSVLAVLADDQRRRGVRLPAGDGS